MDPDKDSNSSNWFQTFWVEWNSNCDKTTNLNRSRKYDVLYLSEMLYTRYLKSNSYKSPQLKMKSQFLEFSHKDFFLINC